MSLSPTEARNILSKKNSKEVERIVQLIDEYLTDKWDGNGNTVVFKLPGYNKCPNAKVVLEVENRFKESGWAKVSIYDQQLVHHQAPPGIQVSLMHEW